MKNVILKRQVNVYAVLALSLSKPDPDLLIDNFMAKYSTLSTGQAGDAGKI